MIGLYWACLASTEAVLRELATWALAMMIFLCLRTERGHLLPWESSSNFSWSKLMTSISAVDRGSDCRIVTRLSLQWRKLSPAESPSCFSLIVKGENLRKFKEKLQVKNKNYKYSLLRFLWKCTVGVWSTDDHFVSLTMRVFSLRALLGSFLLIWFRIFLRERKIVEN